MSLWASFDISIVAKSPVLNATLKMLESILVSASPCVCPSIHSRFRLETS